MRHLWSLIAGVVIAPLVWGLLAIGQADSTATFARWEQSDTIFTGDLLKPAAFLAGAGILLGLIATLRLSPLGPLVAGVVFVIPTVGLLIDPITVRDAFPAETNLVGQKFSLLTPVINGTLLAMGLLLLVAVASVQRWRRWPVTEEPAAEVAPVSPAEAPEPTLAMPPAPAPAPAPAPVPMPTATVPTVPTVPAPREPAEQATATERFDWTSPGTTSSLTAPPPAAPTSAPPPPPPPPPPMEKAPPPPPRTAETAPPPTPRHAATEEPTLAQPPPMPPPPPPPTWPPNEGDRDMPIPDSPWAAPPRPATRDDDGR